MVVTFKHVRMEWLTIFFEEIVKTKRHFHSIKVDGPSIQFPSETDHYFVRVLSLNLLTKLELAPLPGGGHTIPKQLGAGSFFEGFKENKSLQHVKLINGVHFTSQINDFTSFAGSQYLYINLHSWITTQYITEVSVTFKVYFATCFSCRGSL